MKKVLVWAHRGASAYAPENTMEAFELACSQKADGIELDVQMTKDGEVVVIHDEMVDRTSNGSGFVKDMTLEELRSLHFNRLHPEYPQARIPLLEEVYSYLKSNSMTVNVELKNGIIPYPGLEEKVLELEAKYGLSDRVIYSSFNHKSMVKLKAMENHVKVGFLYSDGWIDAADYAEHAGADAIHPALYHLRDGELSRQAHEKGLKIHVWTVDRTEDMENLICQGVDAIITNYPDICRGCVDEKFDKVTKKY